MGICSKCGLVMPVSQKLCPACDTQDVPTLKLYTPRLKAYEMPELFEPVNLDLTDTDEDDEPKGLGKFELPVCIEAVPFCDSDVIFLVKDNGKKFSPGKIDAKLFHTPKEAQTYINETLKPLHSNDWTFVIWSYSALIK